MNIKIDSYRVFNEAAQSLSFSTAAKNLFISQSAVSQTITALEKELGVPLFIRHPKGVTLTKEGERLFRKTKEALDLLAIAEEEITQMHNLSGGELVIGAGDTLCQEYLIPVLTRFREKYPLVHIRIVNGTSLEIIKALKNGALDLAFIKTPYEDKTLTMVPCLMIHDIFVSANYDNHTYTYEEIALQKLIMLEPLSNSRHYVDDCFKQQNVTLVPEMELGAHELLLCFAAANLGISCVIKEFSKRFLSTHQVYELKLYPPLKPRYISYTYLSRKPLSDSAQALIALLPELSKQKPMIF